ncbi:MAG TPA: GatB/YqeY domain-containing protein [Candidatus Acidoferrales bacterium]|nr:GatB/YqeY domain-containing protein [Candidatus Acidoferrales bacterium]
MKLIDKIQADMIAAMKGREEFRLGVLRMVKSALKNKEVEKIRALEPAEEFGILQTLVKQRHEAAEQFTKGGRAELADKEMREIPIIEGYLPSGASAEEMDAAVEAAIAETGANSPKQMGGVVKAARAKLEGKTIDGKALSDRVRARLGG